MKQSYGNLNLGGKNILKMERFNWVIKDFKGEDTDNRSGAAIRLASESDIVGDLEITSEQGRLGW